MPEESTTPKTAEEPQAQQQPRTQEQPDTPKDDRTFTQEDVNNLMKRETAKAQEKLLAELGVDDAKSAKEALEKFKEMQDAQKSETEKAKEEAESEKKAREETEKRAQSLEAVLSAVKAGVEPGKADKVAKLAITGEYEGETVDDKIKAVLDEFPELVKKSGDFGNQTTDQGRDEAEELRSQIRKGLGMREKK